MPQDIKAISEKNWDRWKHDCSGFVRSVSKDLGIPLRGNANTIIDGLNNSGAMWTKLGHDGSKAQWYANRGYFVVAGLKERSHGHVVVIVSAAKSQHYPVGYWGRLGATGRKDTTINWAWKHAELPKVEYFARLVQ